MIEVFQIKRMEGHTWKKSGKVISSHGLEVQAQGEMSVIASDWYNNGATIEGGTNILFVTSKSGVETTYRVHRKMLHFGKGVSK